MTSTRPLIVGLGGTPRPDSSSEQALKFAMNHAGSLGAETLIFRGPELVLPIYDPIALRGRLSAEARQLVDALRHADGIILSSPCYHGGVSGLLKNAIDYTEEMRADPRAYFDGRAVGCIACGLGWQGPNTVLSGLRSIAHALRGWPTPIGVAINTAIIHFENGTCSEPGIARQLQTVAEQVVMFARREAMCV